MKWRWCWIGLHRWALSRPLTAYDVFSMASDRAWKRPTRECRVCGKRQAWLPGYGGSERGCWLSAHELEWPRPAREEEEA